LLLHFHGNSFSIMLLHFHGNSFSIMHV
jgi:hypothetical protein